MIKNFKNKLYDENNVINKYLLPFFILLLFIILNTVLVFKFQAKDEINSDILRLHIVANSNSTTDQIVKLKIENYIKNYISSKNYLNKSELINDISKNSDYIVSECNNILKENNIAYKTTLSVGKIKYAEKRSQTTDMEPGYYNSIQVVLGNGNGKNIWSLIFPDKNTIKNISALNTILPGIKDIYKDDLTLTDSTEKSDYNMQTETTYSLKILEILDNIL